LRALGRGTRDRHKYRDKARGGQASKNGNHGNNNIVAEKLEFSNEAMCRE
jgi:hypothetical protein